MEKRERYARGWLLRVEQVRCQRVHVAGEVACHTPWQAAHQSIELFEVPKVQLNEHACPIQEVLKRGRKLFHVRPRFHQQEPFVFQEEFSLELL